MAKKQMKYDFSGYATRYDVKCSDGRTIRKDAFKDCDGLTVPLVWTHLHGEPSNVLGHGILEDRDDGMYIYAAFNDTPAGQNSKQLVAHGDIKFLSIYANQLVEKSKNVIHGMIREVSLVMAGANPGAVIDNLSIAHGDGSEDEVEDEAIIYTDTEISLPEVKHADPPANSASNSNDETIEDVFNSLTDKQKTVVYAIIAEAVDAVTEEGNSDVAQSDDDEGEETLKTNVFDKDNNKELAHNRPTLSHDEFASIMSDAQKLGSFKQAFLEHAVEYGIENIDYLFPDARTITNSPAMISRKMEWVTGVINGTNHSPFSRIKTILADITADEARAKGYVKGSLKKDEVIKLLHRTTTPKTIYKKQKLDRDDIVDITDLDVVAWLKAEMRVMLDEEIARAVLVGDGREAEDEDKIDEDHLRPIWTDDDTYAHHVQLEADVTTEEKIDEIIRARTYYKGSGAPALYTSTEFLSDMLLLKDSIGRRIYATQAELESVLRVSKIVEVPAMTALTRETDDDVPVEVELVGIIVNLKDYTIGADKGGSVSMFDDFDIDYNQFKYLIETRISGALVLPKSALVIEQVVEEA